jgi:hypothetical protein
MSVDCFKLLSEHMCRGTDGLLTIEIRSSDILIQSKSKVVPVLY